ncbi:MAG: hypothetical protein ACXWC9_01425, partial [Pseudobdellovibrionaceae bacterium]
MLNWANLRNGRLTTVYFCFLFISAGCSCTKTADDAVTSPTTTTTLPTSVLTVSLSSPTTALSKSLKP